MSDENLRMVYEQYWLHARHQETQRLSFTQIYVLILTGVLAYFGLLRDDDPVRIILLVFLILLSLFGYFVIYSWNLPFAIYTRLAELISIREWHLSKDYQRFTKYRKGIRAGRTFSGFYSLMLGTLATLLVYQTGGAFTWLTVAVGAIVSVVSYLCYQLGLERASIGKIQAEFEKKVKKYRKIVNSKSKRELYPS